MTCSSKLPSKRHFCLVSTDSYSTVFYSKQDEKINWGGRMVRSRRRPTKSFWSQRVLRTTSHYFFLKNGKSVSHHVEHSCWRTKQEGVRSTLSFNFMKILLLLLLLVLRLRLLLLLLLLPFQGCLPRPATCASLVCLSWWQLHCTLTCRYSITASLH